MNELLFVNVTRLSVTVIYATSAKRSVFGTRHELSNEVVGQV